MDDRPNQLEEIGRTPMPITPRQAPLTTTSPAAFFAQFLSNNKALTLHASPVRPRHGRSKSLTEGGAKSDFFTENTRELNNNSPLDPDTALVAPSLVAPSLAVATPDAVTPSTSPRGMVVRVPPNTPARSPAQELKSRVLDLESEARDLTDQCDALRRENERLNAELLSRADFGKEEAEQFVRDFDSLKEKLVSKEENLRVLKIEHDQKTAQLIQLTSELEPYTATDLKARVTELEGKSRALDSSLEETRSELDFVQKELQAANDTATDLAAQLEGRDGTITELQTQTSNLNAEIERLKLVAQELGPTQDEKEALQTQLQTQRTLVEQLQREAEHVTHEHVTETSTLTTRVTELESHVTQLREELSRAESAAQTARSESAEQQGDAEQYRALQQTYETLLREVSDLRMDSADLVELKKEVVRKDEQLTRVKSKCAALEEEKSKLHNQLQISEVTVERLTEQLNNTDKSVKQRVTQLAQQLEHVTADRARLEDEVSSHRSHVTALESELKSAQARDQQQRADLARQVEHEKRRAATAHEELTRAQTEHRTCAQSASELSKARDTLRDSVKRLEHELKVAAESASKAAEKHQSELTALRTDLQRTEDALAQHKRQASQPGALVPPHAEMIAALQTRSRDMKTHLVKLKTKSAPSSSLLSALLTVLLLALALVLGLALLSREHYHKAVLYAQRFLPK